MQLPSLNFLLLFFPRTGEGFASSGSATLFFGRFRFRRFPPVIIGATMFYSSIKKEKQTEINSASVFYRKITYCQCHAPFAYLGSLVQRFRLCPLPRFEMEHPEWYPQLPSRLLLQHMEIRGHTRTTSEIWSFPIFSCCLPTFAGSAIPTMSTGAICNGAATIPSSPASISSGAETCGNLKI